MSRPKEYDRSHVLAQAVDVFWSRGLEGTSVSQLVAATGLNTASMYQEFGGKERFYLAALDAAHERIYRPMLQPMRDAPGLAALESYVLTMAHYATLPGYPGCIFLNNLPQKELASPRVLHRVERLVREVHGLVAGSLRAAQRAGEIPADRDVAELTHFVACFIQGLTLYGRNEAHKAALPRIARRLLDSVRQ